MHEAHPVAARVNLSQTSSCGGHHDPAPLEYRPRYSHVHMFLFYCENPPPSASVKSEAASVVIRMIAQDYVPQTQKKNNLDAARTELLQPKEINMSLTVAVDSVRPQIYSP